MEQHSPTRAVLELSPAEDFDRLANARLEIREEDGTLLHLVTIKFGTWDHEIGTLLGRIEIEAALTRCTLRIKLDGAEVAEPRLWPPADNIVKAIEQVVETDRRERERAGADAARLGVGLQEAAVGWEGRGEEREASAREERRERQEVRHRVRTEGASRRPCWVFEYASGLHRLGRYDVIDLARLQPYNASKGWSLVARLGPELKRHIQVDIENKDGGLLERIRRRIAIMRVRKAILEAFASARGSLDSVPEETGT